MVYPTGSLPLTLARPNAIVSAVVMFDGSAIANIVVTDVTGSFNYDIVSRCLTYVP